MAHSAVILTEGDVENPVQGVLDAPVAANGLGQDGRIVIAAGEEVTDLRAVEKTDEALGDVRRHGPDTCSIPMTHAGIDALRIGRPDRPDHFALYRSCGAIRVYDPTRHPASFA